MYKPAMSWGALLAAIAVILGAFGAHSLKEVLAPNQLEVFETGVKYQFYHSFALLIVGIAFSAYPFSNLKLATTFFILGIVFFSGSLYLFPVLEAKNVAIPTIARLITPLGGLFFIIGWVSFFFGIIKKN